MLGAILCNSGYGDFSPSTVPGQVAVIIIILLAFVLVPVQANRLLYLLSLTGGDLSCSVSLLIASRSMMNVTLGPSIEATLLVS